MTQERREKVPNKSLFEMLKLVLTGKKIRREAWKNKSVHAKMIDGKLYIIGEEDGLYHPWTISSDDLIEEDWEVDASMRKEN
jgi:hypothetical protein